jgi:hypothetical protein
MSKRWAFLTMAITIAAVFSLSTPKAVWADGTEKTATGSPKTTGNTTPPEDGGFKESPSLSAMENEILQLKKDLNDQRAILDAQQARIAELEAQLHVSPTAAVIRASGSTADGEAGSVVLQAPFRRLLTSQEGQRKARKGLLYHSNLGRPSLGLEAGQT